MINATQKKLGSSQKIDYSILYDLLAAVNEERELTPEKAKELYSFESELDKTGEAIQDISELSGNLYLPTSVHLMLFGFSFDRQAELESLNKNRSAEVYDHVMDIIYFKNTEGKPSAEEVKEKALQLLETALKEEREKNKKRIEGIKKQIATETEEETEEEVAKEFGEV